MCPHSVAGGEGVLAKIGRKIKKEEKARTKEEAEDTVAMMLNMENFRGPGPVNRGCLRAKVEQRRGG